MPMQFCRTCLCYHEHPCSTVDRASLPRIVLCTVCGCHMFHGCKCEQCDTPWGEQLRPESKPADSVTIPRDLFERLLADYEAMLSGRTLSWDKKDSRFAELKQLERQ